MNVNYLPSFLKELKALRSTPYFKPINTLVFQEIPKLAGLTDIKNVKKLQGYENAYRIKVGVKPLHFVECCIEKKFIAISHKLTLPPPIPTQLAALLTFLTQRSPLEHLVDLSDLPVQILLKNQPFL